jgi:hypothetical protein
MNIEKIRLNGVRCSYPHLFTAHSMEDDGKKKFSVCIILDKKKHAREIRLLNKAQEECAAAKWPKKIPATVKYGLRDGEEREDKDGFDEDVVFFNASCDKRPPVVDKDLSPITAEDDVIYAGCYIDVTVRLWAQDNQFGKRINYALRAVMFNKDGEPFGSGPVDAEDEFSDEDEKPAKKTGKGKKTYDEDDVL